MPYLNALVDVFTIRIYKHSLVFCTFYFEIRYLGRNENTAGMGTSSTVISRYRLHSYQNSLFVLKYMQTTLDNYRNASVNCMPSSHHRHGQDKTVLSCLEKFRVPQTAGVNSHNVVLKE